MALSNSRAARIDLTVGRLGLDRGLQGARGSLRKFAADTKRTFSASGMLRGGRRLAGGMLDGFGMLAGAGAGVGLASIVTDVVDVERALTRLQIATDATPEKMAAVRDELGRVSRTSGLGRDKILAGASAYVALTGDAEGATRSMGLFAQVANATGATMTDIAATAAAMRDNLRIAPADFAAGFSALAVQGKAGAVELRELATELAGIAPSFAQFKGGAGAAGLAEMGASLQVIRKGFGSTSEAATAMRALMVSINRNADKFRAVGVRIYDKDPKTGRKRLRDFSDIVDAIGRSKLARDPSLLTKAFGSDEAKRAYDQLISNRALLDDLISKSSDRTAIERDAALYQESAAGRLERSWNAIKMMIAEALTPERIAAFVDGIERIVNGLSSVVREWDRFWGNDQESNAAWDDMLGVGAEGAAQKLWWDRFTAGRAIPYEDARARVDRTLGDLQAGRLTRADLTTANETLGYEDRLAVMAGRRTSGARTGLGGVFERAGALGPLAPVINVTVKVGADEIAKAQASAPTHRTRPGGR